jgi:hypothetical protein
MENIHFVALNNAVPKQIATAARAQVLPGQHPVDMHLSIKGFVRIGEDHSKTPTVSIPLKEAMALFIKYMGITREHAVSKLMQAMTDALAHGPQGRGAIAAEVSMINDIIDGIVEPQLKLLPKTPVKGTVTAQLQVMPLPLS